MSSGVRITSRQNPRVKAAAQLRTGRERRRRGMFLIDGTREISRAVASKIRCIEAFICEEQCESAEGRAAIDALRDSGTELLAVSADVFEKLSFGDRHEGIVAVAQAPARILSDISLPSAPLVAIVEGVEKPGNLGAILRSADAAGVDAVVAVEGRTDLYNPNTIRASLGTVFRENVCEASASDTLAWLRRQKIPVFAARPDATILFTDADFAHSAAIVLGSEAEGLSDAWQGAGVTPIRLPMCGLADSLNVSTTAAVLFYEALRQRQHLTTSTSGPLPSTGRVREG